MLPAARVPGRYRVELVCLGNICRSPMAHVVLEARLDEAGLHAPDGPVEVTSSGTGDWHVGDPMDRRAAATLTSAGYDASRHRARQHDPDVAADDAPDLTLAMDAANLADLGGPTERVRRFRDLDPRASPADGGSDVPDPYYGGDDGFEEVLAMVERTASALVDALRRERPWDT